MRQFKVVIYVEKLQYQSFSVWDHQFFGQLRIYSLRCRDLRRSQVFHLKLFNSALHLKAK